MSWRCGGTPPVNLRFVAGKLRFSYACGTHAAQGVASNRRGGYQYAANHAAAAICDQVGARLSMFVNIAELAFNPQNVEHVSHPNTEHRVLSVVTEGGKEFLVFKLGRNWCKDLCFWNPFGTSAVPTGLVNLAPPHLRTTMKRESELRLTFLLLKRLNVISIDEVMQAEDRRVLIAVPTGRRLSQLFR